MTTNAAPLTMTLRGPSAIHHARATGARVQISEVRRAHGVVDPARTVTADEAHALTQLASTSRVDPVRVSVVATHGARPYCGAGPVEIDWPAIHAAAVVVDAERRIPGLALCLGFDGTVDAFGGSYYPGSYERDGLPGVVRLLEGAHQIRAAAWKTVHRASRTRDGRAVATCALRTALALDHLYRALAAVGVYRYEPSSQICGVTGYTDADTVQVTGLRWLAGAAVDDRPPTMAWVAAFLAGGVS